MKDSKLMKLVDIDVKDFESVKTAIENAYNKGAWRGGLALISGIAVGTVISRGVEHFKTKEKKEDGNSNE